MDKRYEVFVGHYRGVAVSSDGEKYRNEWVDLDFKVDPKEEVKALRFSMVDKNSKEGVGSGYLPVIGSSDVDALVARILHVLDATQANQALKDLVKEKLWNWFDEKVAEVSHN